MLKKRITFMGKSIPILAPMVLALVLVGAALAAGILLTVTQHIGQQIVGVAPPVSYGSIEAPSFNLANVEVSTSGSYSAGGAVVVVLTADGAGKFLHLKLTEASADLYTAYAVTITSGALANPTGVEIVLAVAKGGVVDDTEVLATAGTYTFTETIAYTAGAVTGSPDVTADVSLEDS